MTARRILVTGGAGFIGHHVVAGLLRHTDAQLVLMDRLDTSGNLHRLQDVLEPGDVRRLTWICHDLKAPVRAQVASRIGDVDAVLHLAAGTHVDRSITDPLEFVHDNVLGTAHVLELCRVLRPGRVLYFSTDEVFGPAPVGVAFKEWDRYRAGNPYAATKAGAEELCLAYQNTYRVPVAVLHCMNVYGERQHPEKFIPGTVRKVLAGERVTVHADASRTRAGSRFWIHASDVASAVRFLLERAEPGEKYNVVGEREASNLEVAQWVAGALDRPLDYELVDFHSSRPGHDLRYALDGSRLRAMGWECALPAPQAIGRTARWFAEHREWLA